jgi:hypothetical protein
MKFRKRFETFVAKAVVRRLFLVQSDWEPNHEYYQVRKAQVEKEQFQIHNNWFTVLEHWRALSRIRRSKFCAGAQSLILAREVS